MGEYQLVVYVYFEVCCSKVPCSAEYQKCIAGCTAYDKLPVQEDNKLKYLSVFSPLVPTFDQRFNSFESLLIGSSCTLAHGHHPHVLGAADRIPDRRRRLLHRHHLPLRRMGLCCLPSESV